MLLSSADIAWMQDTQLEALPGTVVIERRTMAVDGMGGASETWAAVGTVIGRIYPRQQEQASETVAGAETQSQMMWYGTLPIGTDIHPQDRLLYNSRTWEVVSTNNSEMWSTCTRVELETSNEERRI